jgi:hypothetical protein
MFTLRATLVLTMLLARWAHAGGPPPIDGLYCAPDPAGNARNPRCRFLVAVRDGVWVTEGRTLQLVPRDRLTLQPPPASGGPWRLTHGAVTYTQLIDPFLGRIIAHLKGRHVFNAIDLATGKPTAGALTIEDGVVVLIENPKDKRGPCRTGVLFHDPTENHERNFTAAPVQPAPGASGMRLYMAGELDNDDCPKAPDKTKPNEVQGILAGVRVYARADGELQGVQLIGYMYSALYAPAGTSPEVLSKMLREVAGSIGEQAE